MEGRSAADDVGRCQGPRGRGHDRSKTEDPIPIGYYLSSIASSLEVLPPLDPISFEGATPIGGLTSFGFHPSQEKPPP